MMRREYGSAFSSSCYCTVQQHYYYYSYVSHDDDKAGAAGAAGAAWSWVLAACDA
jgi:hypothetical protein